MLTQPEPIQKPVRYLKGIGPKRVEAFKKFGVETLADLFYFFPRRYEDRSHLKLIRDIRIGDFAVVEGRVIDKGVRPLRNLKLFELFIEDDSSQLAAVWFNQPYLMNNFNEGDKVILSGKVEFRNRLQMSNPEYEILKDEEGASDVIQAGRIVPIYPLTEGLQQRMVRISMKLLVDQYGDYVQEFFPADVVRKYGLMPLKEALVAIHFPSDGLVLERARFRLMFDELFLFELALLRDVALSKKEKRAYPLTGGKEALESFTSTLPFKLTQDQEKVMGEILTDTCHSSPMTRLLQGEVGCGKTVVAIFLLLLAIKNKQQAVFMAPTEILAEQQYRAVKRRLEPFGGRVVLLTGSLSPQEKDEVYRAMKDGAADVVVGTHALLQDRVQLKRLAVVIIDEQHKFGVQQRNALLRSTPHPHLLVMTATPIPRTLGLTLFGDLDISTIRELPAGRKPVKTYWISKKKEEDIWKFAKEQIKKGSQIYVICPRIEENEHADIESAEARYRTLSKGVFKDIPMGLVHGRLSREGRDAVMDAFGSGQIKVLVATSMVEVGLDNPNATTMVIEDADRFGLAQLHQMRGRVGRGSEESFCFLVGDPTNEESCRRLRILTKTNDGFQIAEEDLKLRGPGDFLGTRQSGVPWFRLAEFPKDIHVMMKAREAAIQTLKEDSNLLTEKHGPLKEKLAQYAAALEEPV